jgi:SAM-dependent methyltransferase
VSVQPHATWADVYDLAYERTFGELYHRLTEITIRLIAETVQPPARTVDFGAGTGRLSIPLAQKGYRVVAVDPCPEMLRRLKQKSGRENPEVAHSTMQDFQGKGSFDVALCVFTVLLYLLDEKALINAAAAAHRALKPGGILVIDIPTQAVFQGYSISDDMIDRCVSVTPKEGGLYTYKENLKVKHPDGRKSVYSDQFPIKYWPQNQVIEVLEKAGFALENDVTNCFSGTGSSYLVLRKNPPRSLN